MTLRDRLIVIVAILSYGLAAFLPCDAPASLRLAASLRIERAVPAGQAGPAPHTAPITPMGEPSSSMEHAHHGFGGHGMEHDAAPPAAGHGAHALVRPSPKPAEPSHAYRAPCLCGCSDTRSTVGGGASRLGPALLAKAPPRLIEPPIQVVLPAEDLDWPFTRSVREPRPT